MQLLIFNITVNLNSQQYTAPKDPPPLFDLKIVYFYVFEIAVPESGYFLQMKSTSVLIRISSNKSDNHYSTTIRGNTVLYLSARAHLKNPWAEQNYRWAELGQALFMYKVCSLHEVLVGEVHFPGG